MVSFSEGVINEIKSASTETDVKTVVEGSFSRLKDVQIFNESRYVMNMIICLRSMKTEGLESEVINNLNAALELFRQYKMKNHARLF